MPGPRGPKTCRVPGVTSAVQVGQFGHPGVILGFDTACLWPLATAYELAESTTYR